MDRHSKFKNAISHKVHELKSSAANKISIILPSRKVKAGGSAELSMYCNLSQGITR